ncbi:TIGR02710 family CRISPR-associated CARF protein [Candidatus Chloroploca sp. Khr17]|uniref:TIGR02710 family CRISPR-associated CARF protein n=1 Tax=Candidatus Chloroploca sp. Khr17 TaxID=2496869 RepID=UPI00101DBCE0|nr:TIGR02710 family CRISPR-associated CARF protein [Candidatus Chloroploca sp. Khr17]
MPTILLVTVGGSSAPVVGAIAAYQPDYVAFIASKDQPDPPRSGSYVTVDGPGEPCDVRPEQKCPHCKTVIAPRQSKASLVAQAGLAPGRYEVVQVEPDDLNDAYGTLRTVFADLRQRFPQDDLVADYTGGTKTMSAALMLAALERGDCSLSLMTGQRSDLQRVDDGTELATAVDARSWRVQRSLALAEELFDRFDYAAAQRSLEGVVRDVGLTPLLRASVQRRVQLCRGFDTWDRFDHAGAFTLLQSFAQALGPTWQALLALTGRGKTTGFAPVFDLLQNAERRAAASHHRFDDAVARLYRAIELLAQVQLERRHELRSGDLDVAKLPEALRPTYEMRRHEGKVRLGLQDSYALLVALNDPLGVAFTRVQGPLANALLSRNQSILAHGLTPITEREYRSLAEHVETLLMVAAELGVRLGQRPRQFPPMRDILP